ncbi:MAG: carbohydrate ABC transporter permease [Candidatus Izemoplasmataceae bacterium]
MPEENNNQHKTKTQLKAEEQAPEGAVISEKLYETEEKIRRRLRRRKAVLYALLTFFALFIIIPFYWMVITALKTEFQTLESPPILWLSPDEWQFVNFSLALERAPFIRYTINTVTVAIIATVGTVITTILSAFAFARLNFKGRDALFILFIATMMIPGEIFVITNFITVSRFGWLTDQTWFDALLAQTVPFMTSVFFTFFLRQAFKTVPDELYYAAKVDGKTDWEFLWRIMVPVGMPTILTITILNAMNTWNAYIWPNLISMKDEYKLVSNGLRDAFSTSAGRPIYNEQMAAAMIVTVPLIIVFLLLKKYIMRGVSRSGIKG